MEMKELFGNQREFLQWVYDEKSSSLLNSECNQIKAVLKFDGMYMKDGPFQKTFNMCREKWQSAYLLSKKARKNKYIMF